MNPTFNLIDEPWIPCIGLDGKVVTLSLRETLSRAHQLQGIQGESPLVTAALYRLLLAVLHSALRGPESWKEWAALWQAGAWDMSRLDAYLSQWHGRFYLFHPERPFYQAGDERVKPKSVVILTHGMIVCDTLFDHRTLETGDALTFSQAAGLLLVAQSFGIGGLSGLPEKFTSGALTKGILFFIKRDNLFETLALNLVRYSEDAPIPNQLDDRPAWEMDDPFFPREIPRGYLDYLTWQNRRIVLLPDQNSIVTHMTIAPGLRLDDSSLRDPMKHYKKSKTQGLQPLLFWEGRALWRDSSTLLQIHRSADNAQTPYTLQWLSQLVAHNILKKTKNNRLLALGMSSNRSKVFFYRREELPLLLDYFENDDFVGDLSTALEWAQQTRNKLWGAINTMAMLIISPTARDENGRKPDQNDVKNLTNHWGVERNYWGALEVPFLSLIEGIPQDPDAALENWQKTLQQTAWNAFRQAEQFAGTSPTALKAAAKASGQLARGLVQIFPQPEKEETL